MAYPQDESRNETVKVRVSAQELVVWNLQAESENLSLSAWIRAWCNRGSESKLEQCNSQNPTADVSRAGDLPARERGAGAAKGHQRVAQARKVADRKNRDALKCQAAVGPGMYCPECGQRH